VENQEQRPKGDEGEETHKPEEHWNIKFILVIDLPTEEDDVGGVGQGSGESPECSFREPILQLKVRVGD